MSLATEYQLYLRQARTLQMANDADAVRGIERLLARVAAQIREDIRTTPRGLLGERYKRDLLASIDQTLNGFRDEYKRILDAGIVEAARIAEDRERKLLDAVLAERTAPEMGPHGQAALDLSTLDRYRSIKPGNGVTVSFGNVPRETIERLYLRTYRDGLNLSQRLYNLDQSTRRALADTVVEGVAAGESARKLAKRIAPILETEGIDNARFRAIRIARTEINTAFKEGHIASVTNPDGSKKPWVRAIGLRLSPSHPRVCICDALTSRDSGLGPGNYEPGDVPSTHPFCICYTVTLLVSLPGEEFVAKQPRPQDVPESQLRYYGLLK